MVRLHIRSSEKLNEFLFETIASISVADLISQLVALHNLRSKALWLSKACRSLAEFGPLRPEETRGLSEEVAKLSGLNVNEYGQPTNVDPTAQRVGVPPHEEAATILKRVADASDETLITAAPYKPLDMNIVQYAFDSLKGSVMIAYPGFDQLPQWDTAREIIEATEEALLQNESWFFDASKTKLWWAGKPLLPNKNLSDFIGFNEKTKMLVRLQKDSSGAPMREPRIDEATQKGMLAFYHKRQQEDKLLEADDDLDYLNAEWADPKSLKKSLIDGGKQLKWKI